MNFIKSFFKRKRSRVFAIVSAVVLAVLIVADCLASQYSGVISIFLGGDIPHEVSKENATVYYEKETESKDEANENARKITEEIVGEGAILLKNEESALPLESGAKLSVFGKNSVNLVYGGSGSGGGDTTFSKTTLFEGLVNAGFTYNDTLKKFYEDDNRSGKPRALNSTDLDTGAVLDAMTTGESSNDKYTSDIVASYKDYNDAAIVVISRIGGEGFDLTTQEAYGANHYLDLDKNEEDLLKHVSEHFSKVIVLLNTLNIVETDFLSEYGVDACLWIGGVGSTGANAVGEILNGTITPSGKTTDTWSADFTKDPTWNNFADRGVANGGRYYNTDTKKDVNYYYTNYEESVYVGYRYYETRGEQEKSKGNADWYAENVIFPFGYGLSYTSFSWELTDSKSIKNVKITKDGKYTVTVKVTNTGGYKGKDVVELYAVLPYTEGGIEKPYEVLVGFAKTPLLYPTADNAVNKEDATGEGKPNSYEVTIEIDPYDFASYDYTGKSGFTGYVLEDGAYTLRVCSDAHTEKAESIPFVVEGDITWREDNVTGKEVVNRYTNCDDEAFNSDTQLTFLMSRSDLSILPDGYQESDKNVTTQIVNWLKDQSHNNPEAGSYEMPTQGETVTVVFANLIQKNNATGKYYADYDNDNVWEPLLNALTEKEMLNLFNQGAFQTINLDIISKPKTLESDGPVGWCNFISTTDEWKGNNAYPSQVVMSATWNVELIEKMGETLGEEALWGACRTSEDSGLTYSGWYAPGVNIHRSPFGGRNFEYFSEDPFLTGKIAASEIQGCKAKGVYTYVKHFALNEQETHRNGVCSWVTEQAMREIYLKPFEFAVKEGGTTAVMSSFNRIGTRWTGGDYRLLTEILRNEWGFKGTVICDYNQTGDYMNNKQQIYAGTDLNLCSDKSREWKDYDFNSASDVYVLRRAAKNIMYTVANSNAINNLNYVYSMAVWKILLIVANCLIVIGIIVWGVFTVLDCKKSKNN